MLDQKIADGPLRNSVFYRGYLSENDLMEQYQKCTAVVYPSLYEGFGLPVLEAFCMGTRVITSRGTVMEEIAGEAAYYFDLVDARDIARAIGEVLDLPPPDREEYSRFNKGGGTLFVGTQCAPDARDF